MKIKVGVARHKETKRWHILVVREGDSLGRAQTSDELSFATEEEARTELDRQIKILGSAYNVESIQ